MTCNLSNAGGEGKGWGLHQDLRRQQAVTQHLVPTARRMAFSPPPPIALNIISAHCALWRHLERTSCRCAWRDGTTSLWWRGHAPTSIHSRSLFIWPAYLAAQPCLLSAWRKSIHSACTSHKSLSTTLRISRTLLTSSLLLLTPTWRLLHLTLPATPFHTLPLPRNASISRFRQQPSTSSASYGI